MIAHIPAPGPGPHAHLNGGCKTGVGASRGPSVGGKVPPPVRTVSLKKPLSGDAKQPPHGATASRRSSGCDDHERPRCTPGSFALDLLKNLGVCLLVVLYLMFGAFVFLALNEDLWDPHVIPVVSGTTSNTNGSQQLAAEPQQHLTPLQLAIQDSRTRTIERIWDITVNLNILYRDNWTELAGREIERFQHQVAEQLAEEARQSRRERRHAEVAHAHPLQAPPAALTLHRPRLRPAFHHHSVRWNFAQAFLFSLTVITTIGYGSFTPLTQVGKGVTMVYAALGIPLMLLYLSAVGGLLARCARGVFTRAVCCCLCSKCGYCCYDEDRMLERERRLRRQRELKMQQQQQQQQQQQMLFASQSAYFVDVRGSYPGGHTCGRSPRAGARRPFSGSVLAPVLLCGSIMLVYVVGGALALWLMQAFHFLDSVFFCFMSLTTIGFGNLVPGAAVGSTSGAAGVTSTRIGRPNADVILWFCSVYILIGMALTTMCCNVVYTVLLHAIQHAGRQVVAQRKTKHIKC
ncbi:uncharacterized protein LOC113210967 [Frankliniella occidentalis]|uniref:Uncharacterized protein LOC113210967 n=1 Tax=Frankliniella occidentalis TaxID=133901 RepID=A0A6J1SVN1_FRAOC|nr:uncharacterized protein LOC113210967 [Frankliniella occidentalis]